VALVGGRAHDRACARAAARLTSVSVRAGVAVVTSRPVLFRRVQADAGGGVADARVVALIERRADDRTCSRTAARLTGVSLGAGIAVIATGAILLRGVRASAGRWIANASFMALVGRRALNRV